MADSWFSTAVISHFYSAVYDWVHEQCAITNSIIVGNNLSCTMSSKTRQLAVLFDWENMQQGPLVERVLAAVNEYGTPVIKRAYGNWDNSDIAVWKKCLAAHKIDTIQLLDYSDAKNAADRTLINDATNILLSGAVDGFCIVFQTTVTL